MLAPAGFVHEQEFIRAFLHKDRQDRCLYLISHQKRRRSFTDELAHFRWLDERFAHPIWPSTAHTVPELVSLLRRKGAGITVWVISEERSLDAQELPLKEAMERVWGSQMGSILSCIPGKLAFFHGEEIKSERLLERS